jgi:urease accessory protein
VRAAISAAARLDVTAGPPQRFRWAHAWPVVLRPTGGDRVHLVHAAGGPLGGDALALDVDVAAGAALAVRSAGATLVQPGTAGGTPARWTVRARVGPGGRLDWAPEPTVLADGAALHSTLRVDVAAGAAARVREVVVLGRHGQRGGRCASGLVVVVDEVPLLAHTTVLDGADPALRGPAGTAGARAVGTLVLAGAAAWMRETGSGEGPQVRWAWSALEGPGAVLLAVGAPGAVAAVLDAAATEESPGGPGPAGSRGAPGPAGARSAGSGAPLGAPGPTGAPLGGREPDVPASARSASGSGTRDPVDVPAPVPAAP